MALSSERDQGAFTEPLNFKISQRMRDRLGKQTERLDQTLASVARLALALGLEAIETTRANVPLEGGSPKG